MTSMIINIVKKPRQCAMASHLARDAPTFSLYLRHPKKMTPCERKIRRKPSH